MVEKNVESDLGIKSEMAWVIGNLVQLEEHLASTIANTEKQDYMPILDEIRKLRAKYMKAYTGKDLEGQIWCCVKHLLSTSYRLTEVATKNISLENKEIALENLKDSKDLFELSMVLIEMGGKKDGIDG